MKLFILLVAAAVAVQAQNARIDLIDGIRVEFGDATTPLSERVVTRPYSSAALTAATTANDDLLFIEGTNVDTVTVALTTGSCESLLVGVAPVACTSAGTTVLGKCLLTRSTLSVGKLVNAFVLPRAYITQSSLRHTDRICVNGLPAPFATGWVDTELRYQIVIPCMATAGTTASDFTNPAAPVFPTNCASIAALNIPAATQANIFRAAAREESLNGDQQIDWDLADRRSRTQCCGSRAVGVTDPANGNAAFTTARTGVCYDPNVMSCCSGVEDNRKQSNNLAGTGKLINKFTEKCCFAGTRSFLTDESNLVSARTGGFAPMIRLLDTPCPCLSGSDLVSSYCQSFEGCCRTTKYPEIAALLGTTLTPTVQFGQCYDPLRMGCCDTGAVFNSGTQQCCKISGVQSLDTPCPCANNAHCDLNQACCKPFSPAASEVALEAASCNLYTNYFSGISSVSAATGRVAGATFATTAPAAGFGNDNTGISNRCLGQCLDTRFSICCNGNPCINAYERCCNSTCCNKKTESCVMGQKRPLGGRYNDQNAGVFYELCTRVEALTPIRAVLAFFVPIMLLFVTLSGLAFTLYFSKKQNALNPLSAYEKAMATLALLVIFFAWPLFFSPLYKYGVIAIWISFFSILAATCGVKRLLPAALLLQVALLVYIFDPFGGNEILNLGYTSRNTALFALANSVDSGLFLSIMNLWKSKSCLPFYGNWFIRDPAVEDQVRLDFNGAKTTFGYCSREFIGALMIIEILMSMWVIILTVVTLVTYIKNLLIQKVVKQNPFHM